MQAKKKIAGRSVVRRELEEESLSVREGQFDRRLRSTQWRWSNCDSWNMGVLGESRDPGDANQLLTTSLITRCSEISLLDWLSLTLATSLAEKDDRW